MAEESPRGLAIDAFARELGLAFQTLDDLEDALEDALRPSLGAKAEATAAAKPAKPSAKALQTLKTGTSPDPRSILHYLSWKDARAMSLQRLTVSAQGLESAWGLRLSRSSRSATK